MSSCPQVCLQMGSKHAKWGDKQRATTSWQTLGSVSKLAHKFWQLGTKFEIVQKYGITNGFVGNK